MSEWNAVKNIMRQGHRCMNFLHIFRYHTHTQYTRYFFALYLCFVVQSVCLYVDARARIGAEHIAVLVIENVLIELIAILD